MRETMYTLGMICREIFDYEPIPQNLADTLLSRPATGLAMMINRRENTAEKQERIADLMDRIGGDISDGVNGVTEQDQGQFWLGYYHYVTASEAAKNYGPSELAKAGETLFGDRWQTDLSRALKLSDARRIRQWMAGERPIPVGVWADICGLLRHRQTSIQAVLKSLS